MKSFKEQAVRLSYQKDNIKELANELGIAAERVYKWPKVSRDGLYVNKVTSVNKEESSEVKRLRKSLKDK